MTACDERQSTATPIKIILDSGEEYGHLIPKVAYSINRKIIIIGNQIKGASQQPSQ